MRPTAPPLSGPLGTVLRAFLTGLVVLWALAFLVGGVLSQVRIVD